MVPQGLRVLIIDNSNKDAILAANALEKDFPGLDFERVENESGLLAAIKKQPWD